MAPSPGLCMMEFVREVVENLGLQLQVTDNLFGKVRTKLDAAKNIYIYIYIYKLLWDLQSFIYFWLCWVFFAVHRLSSVAVSRSYFSCGTRASHCSGFSCCGAWFLGHRLSSCGTWDSLSHCTWDLPKPGMELVCLALAGRFLTTGPSRKPWSKEFNPLVVV